MIQSIKVAFSSLIAHRRKTWAILASVALGTAALFLVGGYYEYNYWGLKQSLIRSQYGHLQIYPSGYRETRDVDPFAHSLENVEELEALLRHEPGVRTIAPRSKAMGIVNGLPVEIWGVDPESEAELFTFFTSRRGTALAAEDSRSCQMSPVMAKSLGVELDDTVSLSGVRADGQLNMVDLTVQSLIGSYAEEFNLMVLIVPESVFQDLFGTSAIHEISVLYRDDSALFARRDALEKKLSKAGWETDIAVWSEQAKYFRQVVDYYQGFYHIVLAIVAIIVFFATGTTMSLSLLERTREFGTCLSMGVSRARLVREILLEALLAGLFGLVAGLALSFASASAINMAGGIPMPAAPGMSTGISVFIRFSRQAAILSLVTAVIVPLVAVIAPARRIVSKSVVCLLNKGEQ
jgi:putative ABC transport system permease protein